MLAHIEVGAFHARLGLLDDAPDQPDLQRHGFVDTQALHQTFGLLPAEQAHQLIFHGEVKPGRTGVSLAGGAAAQLVIDAPCFVAFGTDHMQPAKFPDALHFFHGLEEITHFSIVNAVIRRVDGHDGLAALFERQIIRVGDPGAAQHPTDHRQDLFGQFAPEFDVHAAPGHIGSDRDPPEGAGSGDDLAFLGVFAGIEHLIGDAGFQDAHQAFPFGLVQLQQPHQAVEIVPCLRVERDVQVARHLTHVVHGQLVDRLVEEFQFRD